MANLLAGASHLAVARGGGSAALGAGRWRIARQLIVERAPSSQWLPLRPACLLVAWGVPALLALAPPNLPRLAEVPIDRWVLAFTPALWLGLPGRNLRRVDLLWPRAGRIMIAERMRLNTQRLTTIRLEAPGLVKRVVAICTTHRRPGRRENSRALAQYRRGA